MSKTKLSLIKIVLSILSSFIGIQSDKNRRRDFSANKPFHFIVIGLALTFLFIFGLYYLVEVILYYK